MPTTVVKMPQLGESIAEGTIGRWLKQPGERVERDEPLLEVQTDKVNADVPSPVAGIVQRLLQPEGVTVPIQTEIAVIGDEAAVEGDAPAPGAGGPTTPPPPPDAAAGAEAQSGAPATAAGTPPGSSPAAPPARPAPAFTYDTTPGGGPTSSARLDGAQPGRNGAPAEGEPKRFYTPVVLRLAQEHGLDLQHIEGSGLGGRVTRRDVERVLAAGSQPAPQASAARPVEPTATVPTVPTVPPAPSALTATLPPTPEAPTLGAPAAEPAGVQATAAPQVAAPAIPPSPATPPPAVPVDEVRGLTPMRRAIAQHMARARAEIPDAWCMVEIDATSLARRRDAFQAEWQAREGFELTFLPFFVKAVLAGLRAVPDINATWQGDSIVLHHAYHLGIAVSLEQGLVVPVLRDADQYSIAGLAKALRALAQRARSGKLTADDLQGATFTVNNPGALGSIMSQPIVPVGQAAIVTMEAIVKRPVVTDDDAIAVRSMMHACLSFDHRVLDGAQALRFLRVLKEDLEATNYQLF